MNIGLSQNPVISSANLKSQMQTSRGYFMESVLLAAIAALFWWFMVIPKQASVGEASANLSSLSAQESQIADAASALEQQVASLDANQNKLAELDEALPLNDNLPRMNLLLNSLVQSAGVTIETLNVSGQSASAIVAGDKAEIGNPYGDSKTLHTYFVAMAVSGSFDQIMALLVKLENSGRIVDITTLNVTGAGPGLLNLQLSANIYSLSPS
ncbi:MAG: hypothetical protein P4L74_05310 [Candidatus Doudnabacteria bacterium]|nr:hypothetical protein [Candidatus Doudnabacteria bacterium]